LGSVGGSGAGILGSPGGQDGVLEASRPPYHANMDAAVDAVLAPPSRRSKEAGPVPYRMSEAEHRAGTIRISAEGLACTKAICSYIHDTYGRFPGSTDAMHLMWVMQAHHIDSDYYDRFAAPVAWGRAQGPQMATWRGKNGKGAAQTQLCMGARRCGGSFGEERPGRGSRRGRTADRRIVPNRSRKGCA